MKAVSHKLELLIVICIPIKQLFILTSIVMKELLIVVPHYQRVAYYDTSLPNTSLSNSCLV